MKLSLRRTPESIGLIYKVFDPDGKVLLTVEREASSFNIWTLYSRSGNFRIRKHRLLGTYSIHCSGSFL